LPDENAFILASVQLSC